MPDATNQRLLEALLDSWDRNNTVLVNLLRALPEGGLEARAMEGSPSIAELFTHIHFVRLVFVFEDAPEFARNLPEEEWVVERDCGRIAQMLNDSAVAVRDAVKSRVEPGRDMNRHYEHSLHHKRVNVINRAMTRACHGEHGVIRHNSDRSIVAVAPPPRNRSTVFDGESSGAILWRPSALPHMYCRTSLDWTTRTRNA